MTPNNPAEGGQQEVLALIPADTPYYTPYSGSKIVGCDACGRACWIGPRQMSVKALGGRVAVCPTCLVENLLKSGFSMDQVRETLGNIKSLGNVHPKDG